ncbi:MAG TPA: 50S ribosomal protein L22 [Syntrophothermus lipocalidus]|uniref:Large ribosomal subunit protein uL22 n=1 Tax=Syntrophothermus lipocalidus (strain DSM 12680 / TGB-C1) TaxID=643648 RepID=D7CJL8_SYNLT|nr:MULTISPECIES: 50S ribosomal protein L22 [Syntrophothermus]ADI02973.1 ribosomal protein L22 [Syntrophothermus lipocalidus DSM 12680]NSW82690.1 50S ribosomal protein L22 [Syntrophothermus sp.]HHV77830.1 50S ribosomal protein L22 [Syntrophothermus lipocalidus]
MEARAVAKYLRVSPFKARQVADLVRGKNAQEAMAILRYTNKKGAPLIAKVLKSAMANAENNFDMDVDALYVAEIYVNEGPSLKRLKPRAYGRADVMKRRTSHITVVVKEKEVR